MGTILEISMGCSDREQIPLPNAHYAEYLWHSGTPVDLEARMLIHKKLIIDMNRGRGEIRT